MLTVSNLRVKVGGFTLGPVDFSLEDGAIAGLVGPNAAGKTTLFRTLAGFRKADVGDAHTSGGRISFIDESPPLFASATVAEHIRFIELLTRRADRTKSSDLIEQFALGPHLDKLPRQLSLGTRRKTALVMGLLRQSEVLLLDEPLNGLDPDAQRELRAVIADAGAHGTTVMVSSHWLPELERVADMFIVLQEGSVRGAGTLGSLAEDFGTPPGASLEDLYFAAVGQVDGPSH